eukprot:scaffold262702_cov30-Tisochrysis_lutea.AAC.1
MGTYWKLAEISFIERPFSPSVPRSGGWPITSSERGLFTESKPNRCVPSGASAPSWIVTERSASLSIRIRHEWHAARIACVRSSSCSVATCGEAGAELICAESTSLCDGAAAATHGASATPFTARARSSSDRRRRSRWRKLQQMPMTSSRASSTRLAAEESGCTSVVSAIRLDDRKSRCSEGTPVRAGTRASRLRRRLSSISELSPLRQSELSSPSALPARLSTRSALRWERPSSRLMLLQCRSSTSRRRTGSSPSILSTRFLPSISTRSVGTVWSPLMREI